MLVRRSVFACVLVAVAALLFAGCGAEEGPLSKDEALELIEQLPESQTLDQFEFEVRVRFDGLDDLPEDALVDESFRVDPESLAAVMEGGFDEPNDRMYFAFEIQGFTADGGSDPLGAALLGDDLSMEMIQDGEESWVRMGFLNAFFGVDSDTWIHSTEGGELDATEGFTFEREDLTSFVDSFEGEIEVVGLEEIRGADTTHILLTVDGASIQESEFWGDVPDAVDELEVHVWLDDQGRLHKVEMTVPFESGEAFPLGEFGEEAAAALEDATMTITFWLFNYDQPLELQVPPDGEIVEQDEIGGLFGFEDDDFASEDGVDVEWDGEDFADQPQFRFFELLEQSPWLEMDFTQEHPDLAEELDALVDEAFSASEITEQHVERLEDLLARIEAAQGE